MNDESSEARKSAARASSSGRADPAERTIGGALHVVRVAHAPGFGVGGQHRGVDVAGTDAVHANALLPVVDRHRLGHHDEPALGRAVGNRIVAALNAPARRLVDDHSAPLRDHRGQRVLGHQPRALEARVHGRVPLLFGAVDGIVRMEHARVVEEDVETAAEGPQRFRHDAFAVAGEPDVRANEHGRAAGLRDRGDHLPAPRVVAAGHRDPGAFLREKQRRSLADPRRGARDDGNAVLQLHDGHLDATAYPLAGSPGRAWRGRRGGA